MSARYGERNRKMTPEDRAYIVAAIAKSHPRKIRWKDVIRISSDLKSHGFSREALQKKPDIRQAVDDHNSRNGPVKRGHSADARERVWKAKALEDKRTIDALRRQNAALLIELSRRTGRAAIVPARMPTPKPRVRDHRSEEKEARLRRAERQRQEVSTRPVSTGRRRAFFPNAAEPTGANGNQNFNCEG
jgi:hypothetical protein